MLNGFGVMDWESHVKPQIITSMNLKNATLAFFDFRVHIF